MQIPQIPRIRPLHSAGKSCHSYYGSVRNFPNNPNDVMINKLYDVLKMSCDIISHYLQRALWDPGLDRSGWWQTV